MMTGCISLVPSNRNDMKTLLAVLFLCAQSFGANHYVTPTGTSGNTGVDSLHAWSLTYAFDGAASISAGDTVWIESGTYSYSGTCAKTGTSSLPIVYRNHANEIVTVYGTGTSSTFTLSGSYIWLWGMEIYNVDTAVTTHEGYDIETANCTGCKFINCIIHDALTNGIFERQASVGTEVYGCTFYYCGRKQSNTKYGYGIYSQNAAGNAPRWYVNNIFINNYGNDPIHCYGSAGGTDSMFIIRNFLTGMLDRSCIEVGC